MMTVCLLFFSKKEKEGVALASLKEERGIFRGGGNKRK